MSDAAAAAISAAQEVPDRTGETTPKVGTSRGGTHAQTLIALAQAAELFHAPDGTAYADVIVAGRRQTWPIRSKTFRQWLARDFYDETGGAAGSEALQGALGIVEAKAQFEGPERAVHVRVAGDDGQLFLDLGDSSWRAVEITAAGWRVVDDPPVRFRRSAGMRALPLPASGGSIAALRPFLNVGSDDDFVLAVSWLVACLRDRGPYPLIVLSGEQGSAKSTFSAILRALIDPNTAALRALPREDRDLFIAATNGHVLAFDNVSGLPGFVSDTLCRLATGAGFAVRQLYTDQDEALFTAARPVILNGIDDIVNRPDLADRALFLSLAPIPEEKRRPESELWAAFEAEKPRLLGALLDAVVVGLKRVPETRLPRLPRMADFALWATACETAHWPAGRFMAAYDGNRADAVDAVIDSDPVAAAVRALLAGQADWSGTASDLLAALEGVAGERIARSKTWPADGRALSGRLRRAATFLRKVGVEVTFARTGRNRTRMVQLASVASASPATAHASVVMRESLSASDAMTTGADAPDDADADRADCREERAAIAQYDGGLSRPEAERLATSEFPELRGSDRKLSASVESVCDDASGEVSQMISA